MAASGDCESSQLAWAFGSVAQYQNTLGSTIANRSLDQDGEAILTPNGSGPYVYVGDSINPPNGDLGSNTTVRVSGTANSFNGELVCNGGAFSGTTCGIRVASTGVTVVYPTTNGVGTVTGMVEAQREGTAAVGQGDSGGPVYAVNSNGTITARGIVSGQRSGTAWEEPCNGWAPTGRVCSSAMFFGPINAIMSDIGVRINT